MLSATFYNWMVIVNWEVIFLANTPAQRENQALLYA
jgi:hypothetical protein